MGDGVVVAKQKRMRVTSLLPVKIENGKDLAKFNHFELEPNFPKILTSHFPDLKIFPKFWEKNIKNKFSWFHFNG